VGWQRLPPNLIHPRHEVAGVFSGSGCGYRSRDRGCAQGGDGLAGGASRGEVGNQYSMEPLAKLLSELLQESIQDSVVRISQCAGLESVLQLFILNPGY
jgi:hypothetical protein